MPCYDEEPDIDHDEIESELRQSLDDQATRLNDLQLMNHKLESALCAVFSELNSLKIHDIQQFINAASQNSKMDLGSFWVEHKLNDEARIIKMAKNGEFTKMSQHDLLMVEILNQSGKLRL